MRLYEVYQPSMYVFAELAYARYDAIVSDPREHKNFIAFIYNIIKDEAFDCQHYAEVEEHEKLTFIESMNRVISNILADSDTPTIRDYICQPRLDEFNVTSPHYFVPYVYMYDTTYDYTERA